MGLTTGTRLGPYEIQSPLGAGGMGEVYKARDTRLDRTVAIKILSDALAGDPDFRDRFNREARTISQLDHPHICALYDVGQEAGTSFLVMQYLEGDTLEARLKKGALPLDEALTIAIQIASALDKAHRAGIVHRDLKPGNVILTKSGAKLLDFGLAKNAPAIAGAGLSMLPTTPPTLTAQGTILGTFQYMAPEQLEGKDAGARADIFAIGTVIYEMLTGRKAFEGKSHASLISAIMSSDPPPIATLQPLIPPALDRLVRKCLAKDPDARWQTARDLRDELQWLASAPQTVPSIAQARAGWTGYLPWSIAGVLLILLAATVYFRPAARTDAPLIRFSIPPPPGGFVPVSYGAVPVVSPDGRRVAFLGIRRGVGQLWVQSLDSGEGQPLAGTETATQPFWSPDSRMIGFVLGATGRLRIIDASGGPVQTVCDAPTLFRGAAWNRDGVIVFGSLTGGLFSVAARGGQPERLTTANVSRRETAHRFPSFLPDGRHFLYLAFPSNTLWVGSLDGKEPTRLINADTQAQYAWPGYLLFGRQRALMVQPFDAGRMTPTGDAVSIAHSLIVNPMGTAAFSASDSGTLVTRTGTSSPTTQLTWVDRRGRSLGEIGRPGLYRNPELSPDGTQAAVEAEDPQSGALDIWLVELARGVASRFTFDPHNDIYPVWSPDGARVAFGFDCTGGFNLFTKPSNGAAGEELLINSGAEVQAAPYSWSPDGTALVYRNGSLGFFNMGILPLVGARKPRLFQEVTFAQVMGQVAPNGRWIAYHSSESGLLEVYVQSFPGPRAKWQVSKDGGLYPRWRGDGRELFYYAADGQLMAVPITGEAALEIGTPTALFKPNLLNGPTPPVGFRAQYAVTRDGLRFLLNVPVEDAPTAPITVVLNWTAGLKK